MVLRSLGIVPDALKPLRPCASVASTSHRFPAQDPGPKPQVGWDEGYVACLGEGAVDPTLRRNDRRLALGSSLLQDLGDGDADHVHLLEQQRRSIAETS